METKLTLRIKTKTIERGKAFAKKRNTSLSKMVENYLDKITQGNDDEITPLVKSISGILQGESADHKKGYADYLEKKYK